MAECIDCGEPLPPPSRTVWGRNRCSPCYLELFREPPIVMPTPTKYLPGTEGKIRVLAARASARQVLHHPEDATFDGLTVKQIREMLNFPLWSERGRRVPFEQGDEGEREN